MTKLSDVLVTNTRIPAAIEAKFTMLPKLSSGLAKFATSIPKGPDLPAGLVTVLTPPAPPVDKLPNPPQLFGKTIPAPATAGLPLSPRNPGAERGTVRYTGLPLSPATPGATRGTVAYEG